MVRVKGRDDSLREEVAGRRGRGAREGSCEVAQPQGIEDVLRQFLQIPTTHIGSQKIMSRQEAYYNTQHTNRLKCGEMQSYVIPRGRWEREQSHW